MVWVTLGLGSNSEPEANLASGLDELLLQFKDLALSNVYRSKARPSRSSKAQVGNDRGAQEGVSADEAERSSAHQGADYLNMAVGINTDLPLQDLAAALKKIEDKHARDRSSAIPGRVTLDIDLLTYADKSGNFNGILLPRPEILTAAHVLWPLSQIAPRHKHPVLKQSFSDLWQAFDKKQQTIAPVEFVWHERVISKAAG